MREELNKKGLLISKESLFSLKKANYNLQIIKKIPNSKNNKVCKL